MDYRVAKTTDGRAKEFYRAMYAGPEPDPETFHYRTDDNDPDDDIPPDSSRVPKRPSPDGGTSAAQAVVEQVEIDMDEDSDARGT